MQSFLWPLVADLAGAVGEGAEVAGQHVALELVCGPHAGALCLINSRRRLVHAHHLPLLYASPARQATVAPRPDLRKWTMISHPHSTTPICAGGYNRWLVCPSTSKGTGMNGMKCCELTVDEQ